MLRKAIALTLIFLAGAAHAQDIAPVISPSQVAEGLYYRSMMEEQARRDAGKAARPAPGTRASQQRACANLPTFRKQHGADHPQVRKLEGLCAQAGF